MLDERIDHARRQAAEFRHRLATPANDHCLLPGFHLRQQGGQSGLRFVRVNSNHAVNLANFSFRSRENRFPGDDARRVFSAEDGEEVAADRAVDGEGAGALEEESEAGGAKEDGEFKIHEAYGSAGQDDDGTDHYGDSA